MLKDVLGAAASKAAKKDAYSADACEVAGPGDGGKKKGKRRKKCKTGITADLNRRKGGGSSKMSRAAKSRLRKQGVKRRKFK
jgi:hypothetical protein